MNDDEKRRLKDIADRIRNVWPDKAAELDRLAADGNTDAVKIKVGIKYKIEKFEGDYDPLKKPIEVIEGEDTL